MNIYRKVSNNSACSSELTPYRKGAWLIVRAHKLKSTSLYTVKISSIYVCPTQIDSLK